MNLSIFNFDLTVQKFLIKISLFVLLIAASAFLVFLQADGSTDPFYLRFTSGKQTSMILGNSRAAQGIRPDILNRVLNRTDLFNYSFALPSSPYGEIYLNSIVKKLNEKTTDGIFILSVDPWSVSDKIMNPNTGNYQDHNSFLATMPVVNLNPNIFYLMKHYNKPYFNLLRSQRTPTLLHDDGWLEVSVKGDSASVEKRIASKIREYKNNHLPYYKMSNSRLAYLQRTIALLKEYGSVYLVRLPVHPKMMEIESQLASDFSEVIREISTKSDVRFLDLTYLNDKSTYTDGNHLQKESGAYISSLIGEFILEGAILDEKARRK